MELCELHVLSALDPSDPSTVMSLVHRARVYKHFLTKILRCRRPNPVDSPSPKQEQVMVRFRSAVDRVGLPSADRGPDWRLPCVAVPILYTT